MTNILFFGPCWAYQNVKYIGRFLNIEQRDDIYLELLYSSGLNMKDYWDRPEFPLHQITRKQVRRYRYIPWKNQLQHILDNRVSTKQILTGNNWDYICVWMDYATTVEHLLGVESLIEKFCPGTKIVFVDCRFNLKKMSPKQSVSDFLLETRDKALEKLNQTNVYKVIALQEYWVRLCESELDNEYHNTGDLKHVSPTLGQYYYCLAFFNEFMIPEFFPESKIDERYVTELEVNPIYFLKKNIYKPECAIPVTSENSTILIELINKKEVDFLNLFFF